MPIFEFKCEDCGDKFEELVSVSQQSFEYVTCPSCGAQKSKKLMSAPSISMGGDSGEGCPSALPGGGCSSNPSGGFS